MATTITTTDIVTEFGEFYLGNEKNQNAAAILKLPYEDTETLELFPLEVTDSQGVERRAEVTQDRILQPFQKAFTPIGTTTLKPKEIAMYRMKIDLEFYPDELVKSWVGFLAKMDDLERANWPFIRWYIERVMMPRHKKDLETLEAYTGVYGAPTPGTAGSASTAMNGIKKTINLGIADTTITPIVLGAVPSDAEDFVTYVENFVAGIPELYRNESLTIAMSKALQRKYRQGVREKYNMHYAQSADLDAVLDNENIKVKGLHSMSGATKIWTTPEWNKARLVNGIGNMSNVKVESQKRAVQLYTDYFLGLGFWVNDVVWTNDVETS